MQQELTERMEERRLDVSVLIVTYRNPELTRSCLRSVLAEAERLACEVLVLDNCSDDGTPDLIAQEFPGVRLFRSRENLGFARGNNVLARAAVGRYLLLLNPDTIVHAGAFAALLAFAESYPAGGLYGGRTINPNGHLDPRSCWGAPTLWSLFCFASGLSALLPRSRLFNPESLGRWQRDTVRHVGIVTGCLALIRRDLWEDLGGFDESFWMYGEDADLSLRVAKRGYRPVITPDAVITHVVGASSSSRPEKMQLIMGARAAVIRKHWSPRRAAVGIRLLSLGCRLRATVGRHREGWRRASESRKDWACESGSADGAD